MSPVKYELGFYIPEDDILHSDRRENLNSYNRFHHCTLLGSGFQRLVFPLLLVCSAAPVFANQGHLCGVLLSHSRQLLPALTSRVVLCSRPHGTCDHIFLSAVIAS
jgi:hypothetical protein